VIAKKNKLVIQIPTALLKVVGIFILNTSYRPSFKFILSPFILPPFEEAKKLINK